MYKKVKDGVFYNEKVGRIVEHRGYSTRIFWSTQMLDYLKRHYPTTTNEELAGCLGVSWRTLRRKARELGLQKDPQWLAGVWDTNRRMGHSSMKRNGNAGWFKKGEHANPDSEFKPGRKPTEEELVKKSEGLKKWYRFHYSQASEKALKAWVTRRSNACAAK